MNFIYKNLEIIKKFFKKNSKLNKINNKYFKKDIKIINKLIIKKININNNI